jgi:hypothetical protein
MKNFRVTFAAGILAAAWNPISPAHSSQDPPKPTQAKADLTGLHDFDFEVGEWRVHHRVKRPADSQQWLEFDGTCSNRSLIDGSANVEEHRFGKPTGVTHGVALRAYDPKTSQWAIWWIDSRDPLGALDPLVKSRSTTASAPSIPTVRLTGSRSARASFGRRSLLHPRAGNRPIQRTRERRGKQIGSWSSIGLRATHEHDAAKIHHGSGRNGARRLASESVASEVRQDQPGARAEQSRITADGKWRPTRCVARAASADGCGPGSRTGCGENRTARATKV